MPAPRLRLWLSAAALMAVTSLLAFMTEDASPVGILAAIAAVCGVATYVFETRNRHRRDR